jgi:5-methylcytosine-specific restriction enzyme subunit McrC
VAEPQVISLTEYQALRLPPGALPDEAGQLLLRYYHRQIDLDFPTPKTAGQWQLRSLGWVGHMPLTPALHLALLPKVPLDNIFRMLEVAYRLDFKLLGGLVKCQSLADFYERLAHILALKVLERGRKGFYRAYLAQAEALPYVRGRLETHPTAIQPGRVKLPCRYEELTADLEENQILAWTLWRIAGSGMGSERTLPTVRQAYRALQGLTTPQPFGPQACLGRTYHRLNEDYRPLHALCYFFLDQSGPTHSVGERRMLPFLIDMARLYELFVAEWLKTHLPAHLGLRIQEPVALSQASALQFRIDLSLYELTSGKTRWVLDTKYKTAELATTDIAQVVTYAKIKECRQAILIYPAPPRRPLDEMIGDIRVRTLTFALTGDLEQAGQEFLRTLVQDGGNLPTVVMSPPAPHAGGAALP